MPTEHVAIQDNQRHEPRGASSANTGDILISNGDATTQWVTLDSQLASKFVSYQQVFQSSSTVSPQQPSGLESRTPVDLGPASSNPTVSLSAAGELTFLQEGSYEVEFTLSCGSPSSMADSLLQIEYFKNNVVDPESYFLTLTGSNDRQMVVITRDDFFDVNDTVKLNFTRRDVDSNNGGLYEILPSTGGTVTIPSAFIKVNRLSIVGS